MRVINGDFPSLDGYENNRQMNVIARAILLKHDIVRMWIGMGYEEIIQDTNDLVLQGQFLICYPHESTTVVDNKILYEKLNNLCKLGYRITMKVFCDILHLFEKRITLFGNDIVQVSAKIRDCKEDDLLIKFFEMSIVSQQNFALVRDFLFCTRTDLRKLFMHKILNHVRYSNQMIDDAMKSDCEMKDLTFNFHKVISFEKSFLVWVLKEYDINSDMICECFDYILRLRVIVSIFNRPENESFGFTSKNIEHIEKLFCAYVSGGVLFEKHHLDLLQICDEDELHKSFFNFFLSLIFKNHAAQSVLYDNLYFEIDLNKTKKYARDLSDKWYDILSRCEPKNYVWGNYEFPFQANFFTKLNEFMTSI